MASPHYTAKPLLILIIYNILYKRGKISLIGKNNVLWRRCSEFKSLILPLDNTFYNEHKLIYIKVYIK